MYTHNNSTSQNWSMTGRWSGERFCKPLGEGSLTWIFRRRIDWLSCKWSSIGNLMTWRLNQQSNLLSVCLQASTSQLHLNITFKCTSCNPCERKSSGVKSLAHIVRYTNAIIDISAQIYQRKMRWQIRYHENHKEDHLYLHLLALDVETTNPVFKKTKHSIWGHDGNRWIQGHYWDILSFFLI
jgi:hypothetical protein